MPDRPDLAGSARDGTSPRPDPGGSRPARQGARTVDGDGRRSAGARTIRVVVGEDSLIVREGVVRLLGATEDCVVAAACPDLPSLRDAIERHRPDVVLTDVRMPPSGTDEGIRLAQELRSTHPELGVVVLSQHVDALYALALFEQGSHRRAYLLKDRLRDGNELADAIREVASGGALVDPRVVDELLTHWSERADSPLERLSPREYETLALVAEGRSNRAIADALGVTERAVERHINAIFSKLELSEAENVNRRVKAALLYLAGRR